VEQLERDPALQVSTLFSLLCVQHPGKYAPTQVRTLQRQVQQWRLIQGPEKEVYFEQIHHPGERMQSDFTHMEEFQVTIAGNPFPHMLYHSVLTYSNVEAVSICFAETFEALAEGIERALWQFGGVPLQHRTDHLTAAVKPLSKPEHEEWTQRYAALMNHYGMTPTTNNTSVAHENGDIEQSHYRFQQAVDQALRVRGSRDFATREAYAQFLQDLVRYRNNSRAAKFAQDQQELRPLPKQPLAPCRELHVSVSRFSTIAVLGNTYSVPSRLIASSLLVRVRAEHLEVYVGSKQILTLPRLHGKGLHAVNYRHLIWSLARKPGAFADYRYRDDLYPTLAYRRAYDRLLKAAPARAEKEYVRVLHLAATLSETEVEIALALLEEADQTPTADAVRDLVRPIAVRQLVAVSINLKSYDQLLSSQRSAVNA
jgi:hypothetical protein